jgi:very-short-patch-repair endonuclease
MKIPFLPYNKKLIEVSRDLRRNQTPAEKIIWNGVLRYKKLRKYKFLRQKPIDNFIVDFYCPELLLIIEVDGDVHDNQKTYDQDRTNKLAEYGLHLVRYTNQQIINDINQVNDHLNTVISARETSSNLP